MAINENIAREVMRAVQSGKIPTEVFMSTVTRHHLSDELYRRVEVNYHNPKHITMRGKPKAVSPSEMRERVPTELTYGSTRVKVVLRESVSTDSFVLEFKKLVPYVDYRTGRQEYARTEG
jgi:hypothetical protein